MSHEWAKALLITVVLTVLALAGMGVADWRAGAQGQESMAVLGIGIFDTYVFAFEALSVLLLGALIAALYLGQKPKKEGGSP